MHTFCRAERCFGVYVGRSSEIPIPLLLFLMRGRGFSGFLRTVEERPWSMSNRSAELRSQGTLRVHVPFKGSLQESIGVYLQGIRVYVLIQYIHWP